MNLAKVAPQPPKPMPPTVKAIRKVPRQLIDAQDLPRPNAPNSDMTPPVVESSVPEPSCCSYFLSKIMCRRIDAAGSATQEIQLKPMATSKETPIEDIAPWKGLLNEGMKIKDVPAAEQAEEVSQKTSAEAVDTNTKPENGGRSEETKVQVATKNVFQRLPFRK